MTQTEMLNEASKRPRRVTKVNQANKNLSKYLAIKDLSDEVKTESKKLSVFMKRLFDKGLIDRKKVNQKDYEYNVINKDFIDWFCFRNKIDRK